MTKELQDHVWKHCLPKEFKEAVKSLYTEFYNEKPHSDCSYGYLGLLIKLFGTHNLTFDAEGEDDEMLYVSRKKVHEVYNKYAQYVGYKLQPLLELFGSKCLPDDKVDDKNSSNFERLEKNEEIEPKYHRGEKVRYNGYVYEVEGLVGKNRYALKGLNFDLDEDMIDPTPSRQMRIS